MKTRAISICLHLTAAVALLLPAAALAGGTKYYNHYMYNGTWYGYDEEGSGSYVNRDRAVAAYNADYADYQSRHAEWKERKDAFDNYSRLKTSYDQRYAEYLRNKQNWEDMTGGSGAGVVIDRQSYVDGHPDRKIVTNLAAAVEVPQFSDISAYRQYCQEYICTNKVKGGTLDCLNQYRDSSGVHQISFTYTDTVRDEYWSSGEGTLYARDYMLFSTKVKSNVSITRTVAAQHISGGYAGAAVYPFSDKVSAVSDTCEKSCVVLIGTYNYPIELNGPVYVDGDVIIRGFVRGQGSIYSGRNIHIIGDLTYFNPPDWPHSSADLRLPENTPEKVKAANAGKDLLLLAARGNIIVGDYTSLEWTNATQMTYLDLTKSGRTLKAHATSESDIGYSSGYPQNKNYTLEDGGKTIQEITVANGKNQYGYLDGGGYLPRGYYIKTITPGLTLRNRRYYESSLGALAIRYLKQTSVDVNAKPTWQSSSTLWKRILAALGWYEDSPTITDNTDSGDVTEIDAILYANHGIFGVAGGAIDHKLHLNGAIICRDEGLLTSFAGRFKNYSDAKAWVNWDMRIKSDLDGSVHIGAPEKDATSKGIGIKRVTWSYLR